MFIGRLGPDPAGNQTINNNLIAYWTFDETSGNRYDSVAGRVLAPQGTVTVAPGLFGNSAWPNQGDSPLTYFHAGDLTPVSDMTWVFWLKIPTVEGYSPSGTILDLRTFGGTDSNFTFTISGGGPVFGNVFLRGRLINPQTGLRESVTAQSPSIGENVFHMFVIQINTAMRLVDLSMDNGAFQESSQLTSPVSASAGDLLVLNASSPTEQYIDEMGIWGRLLTADELTYLYNGGVGRTYPLNL